MWLAVLAALALGACRSSQTIVIYHTSDIHGGIQSRQARWHTPDPTRRVGGIAALTALVKKETKPWVLLDSGDIFQGTPEGNLTRGEAVVVTMNAAGYQAMVVGNHEYDYGEDNLEALAKKARFPMLAANIFRKADNQRPRYVRPTHMLTVGNVRVGLVGLATRHTATSTLPQNVAHLRFEDEAKTAKEHAIALRKQGAEVVIAMSHCGLAPSVARKRLAPEDYVPTKGDGEYQGDLNIARNAPVDMVLGGHMHTGFEGPWVDPKSGVAIVQSFANLTAASRIEVTVMDGEVVSVTGRLIDLWIDETGEDPAVLKILSRYQTQIGKTLDQPIGHAQANLVRAPHTLDNPLGNWMTDVMREATHSDVAIQNSFGIRADLHAGPLTLRDLYQVMPFDNTLVVVELTGAELTSLIRKNLRGGKSRLQVSGIVVSFAWDRAHDRATRLRILHKEQMLNPEARYRVVTNNFLSSGGSGAGALATAKSTDTGQSIRSVLVEHVKAHSPISAPPVGRFVEWSDPFKKHGAD